MVEINSNKNWFFDTLSKLPENEKLCINKWLTETNNFGLQDEVYEYTRKFVNEGQTFINSVDNAMYEWDL